MIICYSRCLVHRMKISRYTIVIQSRQPATVSALCQCIVIGIGRCHISDAITGGIVDSKLGEGKNHIIPIRSLIGNSLYNSQPYFVCRRGW